MELIRIANRKIIEAELYNYSDTKKLLEENIDSLTTLEILEYSRRLIAIDMALEELGQDKANKEEIINKAAFYLGYKI